MLSHDVIEERAATKASGNAGLYRSLSQIASDEPKTEGLLTGLDRLDRLTGGLRPAKLNLVGGYSGNGKTALMLSIGVRNMSEDAPWLFFTADDSDDAVLQKVLAMHLGVPLDEVETRGPRWRTEQVRDLEGCLLVAAPQRSSTYTAEELLWVYEEATEAWGIPPKLVCFDYLSLLGLSADSDNGLASVKTKAAKLKSLARRTSDSVWLVGHQCKKEAGSDCPALTLNHLEFGGHQEADGVVLGCRRRLTTTKLPDWEMELEEGQPTTNVSVMKNKVTGRTSPDPRGVPYVIDPATGLVRDFADDEQRARDRKGNTAKAGPPIYRYPKHETD
jgi:hypothetical protein